MDLNFCRTLCSLPRLLSFSHYLLGRFLPPCIHPCSCSCRKHASSNLHMLTPHFPQESAWIAPPLKGSLTNLQVSFSALAIYNYPTSCYIFIANFLKKLTIPVFSLSYFTLLWNPLEWNISSATSLKVLWQMPPVTSWLPHASESSCFSGLAWLLSCIYSCDHSPFNSLASITVLSSSFSLLLFLLYFLVSFSGFSISPTLLIWYHSLLCSLLFLLYLLSSGDPHLILKFYI